MNPNTILFGGEVFDGRDEQHPLVKLRDGSTAIVRVRQMPARHLMDLLDLFHVGREADLIQRCAERGTPDAAGAITWQPLHRLPSNATDTATHEANIAGAAFVDSLDDASHELISTAAEQLNFKRAIATAQRQIARGTELGPTMQKLASIMLEPIRKELSLLTSLPTTASSPAAADPKR